MRRSIIAVVLVLLAGCGGGEEIERNDVSGSVTFAGKPVVYGSIEFVPDTGKQHEGPAGSAEIQNGQFNTAETGGGIVPGAHLVRITAYEQQPPPASEDETVPSNAPPPLFTGYTIEADVHGPTQDFEVPESARGFDLFSSGAQQQEQNPP